jgi:hypothetical protein
VTLATQDCLNGESSPEWEFPIANRNLAPQLKVKTRLTHSTSEGSSSTQTLLGHQNGNCRLHPLGTQSNGKSQFEMPEVVPLTPQEEVILAILCQLLLTWLDWHSRHSMYFYLMFIIFSLFHSLARSSFQQRRFSITAIAWGESFRYMIKLLTLPIYILHL